MSESDSHGGTAAKAVQKWPRTIWIVRHGESAGNVARDAATKAGLAVIDINIRDVDVPLSDLGRRQAAAVGLWFKNLPPDEQPTVILASPYKRAQQTTDAIVEHAALTDHTLAWRPDERLREKEFGILDRLTSIGIKERYPEQAELRRMLGKFYHRPPGGESWCDVILRLRSVLDTLRLAYEGERVLIVCHTVVVLCFRYLLEGLDEEQILAIDRENDVANCSITSYTYDKETGSLRLRQFNDVTPLKEVGEDVTHESDALPVAPRG